MGNKLSNAINVEAHSASENVIKEFKRLGAEIKLLSFSNPQKLTQIIQSPIQIPKISNS